MTRAVFEPEARTIGSDRVLRESESPSEVKVTSEVEIEDTSVLVGLTGPRGERLKAIERELSIECGLRGNTIFLKGPAESVVLAERFFAEAAELWRQGVQIGAHDVGRALRMLRSDARVSLRDMFDDVVTLGLGRKPVGPRGLAQKRYVESIRAYDLTFGIGPAGTGKTYLAMACAVAALQDRRVKRIVLTRPAVEAGEKLGFLPGDLAEKVNPYLRPLFDALGDMMDIDRAQGMMARGQIEVAPLAFMRGRTLNDSFVILDEAQNTTSEQMRMFLTRLGSNSRAVVTGDVTQVDLPDGRTSGLAEARQLLSDVEGIAFCTFTDVDVVRHPLVQKIIVAYEQRDSQVRSPRAGPPIFPHPAARQASDPPPSQMPATVARPPAPDEPGEEVMTDATRGMEGPLSVGPRGPIEPIFAALKTDPRLAGETVTRPHPLLAMLAREEYVVVIAPAAVWDRGRELLKPFAPRFAEATALLVLLGRPNDPALVQALSRGLGAILPAQPSNDELVIAVHRAFELLDAKARAETRGKWLTRYRYESSELVNIARAMTTARDVDVLLGVILEKSRFVTGADAGSIYVAEGEEAKRMLRFKLTQNDSVTFDSREFVVPVSNRSMAGSAALEKKTINIADAYELPATSPFAFDRSFDVRIGYRTKSMLAIPLISQQGDVIGVIQLINKKKDPDKKLFTPADVQEQVVPFDERSEELLGLVAAQASVSLENALLYDEIRRLFEGFVKASVEAIESRDPTTSGHSRRVADLTVGLAKIVDKETAGPYRGALFSREDLRELEYASLLHDFGKIGVREKVLIKAKKLYDERLELIRARFDFVARSIEADLLARKVRALERGGSSDDLKAIDEEMAARRKTLDEQYDAITSANEPTVMAAGDFARIEAIARETYSDLRGDVHTLLTSEETLALSVKRGSLTDSEFDEIRSHVSHTFRFLSRIPWGKAFRRVPLIAGAHHERLNGTGYPNRLRAEEIPVQSKMMSIADIYDALTASDRPYKKAIPVERAIDILEYSVKDGHLDAELVRIFREGRVWERRAE